MMIMVVVVVVVVVVVIPIMIAMMICEYQQQATARAQEDTLLKLQRNANGAGLVVVPAARTDDRVSPRSAPAMRWRCKRTIV